MLLHSSAAGVHVPVPSEHSSMFTKLELLSEVQPTGHAVMPAVHSSVYDVLALWRSRMHGVRALYVRGNDEDDLFNELTTITRYRGPQPLQL